MAQVESWAEKALLAGLGRSEVIRLMESTTGCRPSDSLLKRVRVELDRQAKEFRERPLTGRYDYLFLEAAWAKDIVGVNAASICIMTAVGITYSGEKEILGLERTPRENEANWRGFLSRLVGRGLNPCDLALVISDEHSGLLNASSEVLGDVPHQLCWAHRMRNVRKRVDACDRKQMVAGLQSVYQADNLARAKDALRRWCIRWQQRYAGTVRNVQEDSARLLAFLARPQLHWEYVRTSNPIERVFRELRRQQYECGAFAEREACNRAVYRVFVWLNGLWAGKDIWQPRGTRTKRIAVAA